MNFVNNFRHYLVLASLGYISGIIFTNFSESIVSLYSIIFLIVFVIILFIKLIFCILKRHKFLKIMTLSLLFVIPFISGELRFLSWNNNSLKTLHNLKNDNALYVSKITSIPEKTTYNTMMANAFVFEITNNQEVKKVNMNIRLFFKNTSYESIGFGDTVEFYAAYVPEANQYSNYQKAKNQVATLSAIRCIKINKQDPRSRFLTFLSDSGVFIRNKILTSIDKVYSYNPESATVNKAILTGNKSDFSDGLYDAFKDAGFLHVAAISGTHVSILFSILSVLLLNLRINKKITIAICSFVILIFSSVASFTPSVLRAAIMLILSMFSMILNRDYDPITALFFSAVVILIIYPYALFTSGFLLSFGATLGIVVFYKYFSNALENLCGKLSSLLMTESISVSVSAFLGTAPFTLLFFDSLSLWSILTNIWIVPLVYIIFCLGLFSSLFYYIYPPLASVLTYLNEPCIYIVIKTAQIFSNLKFGIISPDYIPWCFYVYYAVFFFVLNKFILKSKSLTYIENRNNIWE